MKTIVASTLILCLLSFVSAQSTEAISSGQITFNFVEKDVQGSISGFTSSSRIDWNAPENTTISGSVKTETIKTGNFIRDWSLRGSKYFDADEHPEITFKSERITFEGDNLLVDGILTMKGVSKSIQIRFKKDSNQLQGTTTLFSSDFGITILKKGREANKVTVEFNLQLD